MSPFVVVQKENEQIYDRKSRERKEKKKCFDVRFDEEAHGTFRRIDAADDGKAETLFARAFLVDDCVKRVRDLRARPARQRTKVGTFLRTLAGLLGVGASRATAISQVATNVDAVGSTGGGRDAAVATAGRWVIIIRVQRLSDLRRAAKGSAAAAAPIGRRCRFQETVGFQVRTGAAAAALANLHARVI